MSDEHTREEQERDWTRGPAGGAAIGVLALICVIGIWASTQHRGPVIVQHGEQTRGVVDETGYESASIMTERPRSTHQININTATQAQLELLPSIGPALASRIVADRTENGAFASVIELQRVRGIGSKTFAKLAEHITIGDADEIRVPIEQRR